MKKTLFLSQLSQELEKLVKEFAASLKTADNLKSNAEELEKISRKRVFKTETATIFKITDLRYLLKLKCTELTRNIVDKYLLS